jgi:uncharacterized protein
MQREGTEFHRLVEMLERGVFSVPGATVQSPGYLRDKVTGRKREHDIVITYSLPYRSFVVAVECRDRKRPVDDTQVEAFARKCSKTGVDKGIIVSSSGFAPEALTDAAFCNIDCFTLEQVSQLEWVTPQVFETLHRHVTATAVQVIGTGDESGDLIEPLKVVMRENDVTIEMSHDDALPLTQRLLNSIRDEQIPGEEGSFTIELPNPGDVYLVDGLAQRREISGFLVSIHVETRVISEPINLYQYRSGQGATLFGVETARIGPNPHIEGSLVLVRRSKVEGTGDS